jgi:hypothetical protein
LTLSKIAELAVIPVLFVFMTAVSYACSLAVAKIFRFDKVARNFVIAMVSKRSALGTEAYIDFLVGCIWKFQLAPDLAGYVSRAHDFRTTLGQDSG